MSIAQKIIDLRKEKGDTQNELAKKIGTTNKVVWTYEKGRCEPSIDLLIKLADYFNVSVDYLIGRTDELGIIQNDNANKLNSDDAKLLKYFHGIDEVQQRAILRTAESFYLEAQQNKKAIS